MPNGPVLYFFRSRPRERSSSLFLRDCPHDAIELGLAGVTFQLIIPLDPLCPPRRCLRLTRYVIRVESPPISTLASRTRHLTRRYDFSLCHSA